MKRLLIPKVDADAGQRPSDAAGRNGDHSGSSDGSDSDSDDEDEARLHLHDGKKIKEKVGFRERKVKQNSLGNWSRTVATEYSILSMTIL